VLLPASAGRGWLSDDVSKFTPLELKADAAATCGAGGCVSISFFETLGFLHVL
jgi:hypothetical protein